MKSSNLLGLLSISVLLAGATGCGYSATRVGDSEQGLTDDDGGGWDSDCFSGIYNDDGTCYTGTDGDGSGDGDGDGDGGDGDGDGNSGSGGTTYADFTGAAKVAAGAKHTCAIMTDKTVRCFGDNTYNQLGGGISGDRADLGVVVPGLSGVTAISAGAYHTCAIGSGALVYCWGRNNEGQLGNGNQVDSATPKAVVGLPAVTALAVGDYHSCAVVNARGICWGKNDKGQLGNGSTAARSLKPLADLRFVASAGALYYVDQVTAGGDSTCVLTQGSVYCAGDNTYGQLGNTGASTRYGVKVGAFGGTGTKVLAADMGAGTTCALRETGDFYCWGRNDKGQLSGQTSAASTSTPTLIVSKSHSVARFNLGGKRVCAVLDDSLYCWGESQNTTASSNALQAALTKYTPSYSQSALKYVLKPVLVIPKPPVLKPSTVKFSSPLVLSLASNYQVSSAFAASSALTLNSALVTTVTSTAVNAPTAVSGVNGTLKSLSVGASHVCAVAGGSGTVYCWGTGTSGQLGNPAAPSATASAIVSKLAN